MRTATQFFRDFVAGFLDFFLPRRSEERHVATMTAGRLAREAPCARGPFPCGTDALFAYRNPLVRELIWLLKYRENMHAARLAASVLFDTIVGDIAEESSFSNEIPPLLTPIPASARRIREQGCNHLSLVLAEMSVKNTDVQPFFEPKENVLYHLKDIRSQTTIKDKSERMQNLQGAFGIKDTNVVAGRHVIVIDDVTTTGATFAEATRALREAGAARVSCYAIAH